MIRSEHRQLAFEEMKQIAVDRGGLCLSNAYINAATNLHWQCLKKHKWHATPHSIKDGSWCLRCYHDSMRGNLEKVQALAQQRGGQLLSKRYVDSRSQLRWKCAKGHIWQTTAAVVSCGRWCPQCSFDAKRGTIEKMRELAVSKGGFCLSNTYVNNTTSLQWQCAAGHVWRGPPERVRLHWCPKCSFVRLRLGIDKMREIAQERGGRCLSDIYTNVITPLSWQCMEGHTWEAMPVYIRKGRWCPECRRVAQDKQKKLDVSKKKKRFSLPQVL
jgi:hypothetical protein